MVVVSLYRANMHKGPHVPRRWLLPKPRISLEDFKLLQLRRSKALSRLRAIAATTTATSSNPNPNPSSLSKAQKKAPTVNVSSLDIQYEALKVSDNGEGPSRKDEDRKGLELVGSFLKKLADGPDSFIHPKTFPSEKDSEPVDGGATSIENQIEPVNFPCGTYGTAISPSVTSPFSSILGIHSMVSTRLMQVTLAVHALFCAFTVYHSYVFSYQIRDEGELFNDKRKRKREIEDLLEVLNEKKHNVVRVLKQILNVEEELKRQKSMLVIAKGPSVPLQADGTNDSGSMTKHLAPRIGSEANLEDDVERGAADDLSNHKGSSSPYASDK